MNELWWERPVCLVCDFWWVLLALILALIGFSTRSFWLPTSSEPELGTGDVQATLRWNGQNDLDLHIVDPEGNEIFYQQASSPTNGRLDVDSNAGCEENMTSNPIENIFWENGEAPQGEYKISVHYFQQCTSVSETSFEIRLLVDGEEEFFEGSVTTENDVAPVHSFNR